MADTKYFDKIQTKGRPKFVLNEAGKKLVVDLATVLCTDEEIASIMETTVETLQSKDNYNSFLECKKKGINKGKGSLRRKQYELAMKGNCTMLIWLGRNYLDQKETIEKIDDEETKSQLKQITDAMAKIRERE